MKQISLHRIGDSARLSARRFPLVLVLATVAAIAAIDLIDSSGDDTTWLMKLMLTAQLGIPLLLAVAVATEAEIWPGGSATSAWIARGVTGLLLVVYYFALPTPLGEAGFVRHIQLNVAAHLAVAVLPFLRPGHDNAFWQFNLGLALRLLAALFFSHVLFGGLSVALLALDNLLGVDVDDNVYPQLWVAILFIFNTWYFLAGVPERSRDLDSVKTFPAIVKVFAQFILTPLVLVYLAILSAYLVKVVVSAEWPSGQIGYLVSSVAVAGIFSLLLLYPLSVRPGNRWVGIYARLYYILLVPAVVMLLMAIGKRIGQYGVTENRYLLTVMAIWLAGVVVAGVVRGRPFLKIIPASLAIVAVVTAFGPLSASQVSRRSQLARLDVMLSSHDRLVDGRIVAAAGDAPRAEGREMGSILVYLFSNHGPGVLGDRADSPLQNALAAETAKTTTRSIPAVELANAVTRYANLPRVLGRGSTVVAYHRVEKESAPRATKVAEYDYVIEFLLPQDEGQDVTLGSRTLRLDFDADTAVLTVIRDDTTGLDLDLNARLLELADTEAVAYRRNAPDSLMSLTAEGIDIRVKLLIETINWREETDGANTLSLLQGTLLVSLKNDPGYPDR